MELHRHKNTDTRILFALHEVGATGGLFTGASGFTSEYCGFNSTDHGSTAPTFTVCTHETVEVTGGWYYLDVQSTEVNYDFTVVQVKTTNANTQEIYISTQNATGMATGAITEEVFSTGAVSSRVFATGAVTSDVFATGSVGSTAVSTGVLGLVADYVWDEGATGHTGAGSFGVTVADCLRYQINKMDVSSTSRVLYNDGSTGAIYTQILSDSTGVVSRTKAT